EIFASRGEAEFRALEERAAGDVLARAEPVVLELGGGALGSQTTRDALARHAFVALLDVDADEAWRRVAASDRPLASDPDRFRSLYEEREPVYAAAADGRGTDVDGLLLTAGGVHVQLGAVDLLDSLVPGENSVELVSDRHVAGIYGVQVQIALGARLLA